MANPLVNPPLNLDIGVLDGLIRAHVSGNGNGRVQLIDFYEELDPDGEPFDPPYFHLTLSDSVTYVNQVVPGPALAQRLRQDEFEVYDIVQLRDMERWVSGYGAGISLIAWDLERIQGRTAKIGHPLLYANWSNVNSPFEGYLHSLDNNEAAQPSSPTTPPKVIHQTVIIQPKAAQAPYPSPIKPKAAQSPSPSPAATSRPSDWAPQGVFSVKVESQSPKPAQRLGTGGQGQPTTVVLPGLGAVPPALIARSPPLTARPPPPVEPEVDLEFPADAPLQSWAVRHYATHPDRVPGVEAQPPALPFHPPGWGRIPSFTPIRDIVANSRGLHVRGRVTRIERKRWTVDVVLHDNTAQIDLVVRKKLMGKAAQLEEGEVYEIHNVNAIGAVQIYCRSFHPAQLDFVEATAEFVNVPGDRSIPMRHFNLRKIVQLPSVPDRKPVDIACVIANTSEVMFGKGKSTGRFNFAHGAPSTRVDMWLVDETGSVVRLVAFDEFWPELEGTDGTIALFHNVLVDTSRGLSVKTDARHTEIFWGEDIPGYDVLSQWWEAAKDDPAQWHLLSAACSADGAKAIAQRQLTTLPPIRTITQVREEKLDAQPVPRTFRISGTIEINVEKSVAYQGCATRTCNRKMTLADRGVDNLYHCPVCRQSFMVPVPKYCLHFWLVDEEGERERATSFNTAAESILGLSATTMLDLFENNEGYRPIHTHNLERVMRHKYTMTVQGSTRADGYWRGRPSWIVTEFFKIGNV